MARRKLVLEFTKMNGAGNDFVVIDNRFYNFSEEELAGLARRLCPRRTGIGADGLLAFDRAEDPSRHAYRMRYHNADGSLATMCGNGARCLALFARQAGLEEDAFAFESDAGVYRARFAEEGVRIYATPPRDFSAERALAGGGTAAYVWTGTPHVVRFVEEAESAPVEEEGRRLRHDAAFAPEGANANFVQVEAEGGGAEEARLRVRTFEKGVEAETEACGTGALAAAVVAGLVGRIEAERVAVVMPGGTLYVGFRREGEGVTDLYLEGPAEVTFRGTVEV